MLTMVASHNEQIKIINKNIDKLDREVRLLRGEYDNYGDIQNYTEHISPTIGQVFQLLRGGK